MPITNHNLTSVTDFLKNLSFFRSMQKYRTVFFSHQLQENKWAATTLSCSLKYLISVPGYVIFTHWFWPIQSFPPPIFMYIHTSSGSLEICPQFYWKVTHFERNEWLLLKLLNNIKHVLENPLDQIHFSIMSA